LAHQDRTIALRSISGVPASSVLDANHGASAKAARNSCWNSTTLKLVERKVVADSYRHRLAASYSRRHTIRSLTEIRAQGRSSDNRGGQAAHRIRNGSHIDDSDIELLPAHHPLSSEALFLNV
jgi:hypothetical protein